MRLLRASVVAFSLVELSIVLVILGLLVGGILSGQSLIRAAEIRAVATEYSRYVTAAHTFRDKYFALPGDFSNATRFWGRMAATVDCVTNSVAAVAATGACDGNGDGRYLGYGGASASAEVYQYWRHLALAGLIEGTYSGLAGGAGNNDMLLGTNAPSSKLATAGWGVYEMGTYAGDADMYAMDYGITLELGSKIATSRVFGKVLKPEEAWNIDTKIDDGKPAQGKVIARYWNNLCAAADDGTHANNDLVASYKLSETTVQCSFYFRNPF
ncbi:MAG: pilus assembly FimT family protein [Rickettsiales bacterium]